MLSKTPRILRFALHSIAAGALLASASGQIHAEPSKKARKAAAPPAAAAEPVTLNFANADIEAVARTMATITGRNVVVDPRVKGQVNLVAERPVPPAVAFDQFLAALRLQGFTVVEAAGLYKVVPEADAKLQAGSVGVSQGGTGTTLQGGQIATQIFKLNFENANNLVPVLRPLISPNNTINVNPGNNSLVITDYADNLQRIARIVAAMDVANATDVEIIPLHHAVASDLLPLLTRLVEGGTATGGSAAAAPGQSDTSFKTTLLAEPRSNAIVVRAANPARVAQIRSLVARLDQPAAPGSSAATGNIHVVYLKNADAVKLAVTLRAAMGAMGGASAGGGGASSASGGLASALSASTSASQGTGLSNNGSALGGGSSAGLGSGASVTSASTSNQPSTGGFIQADPSTNSLIITAPDPLYRQLRAVIDKLDGRRAQVLVESMIVEVKSNKLAQFGVQWQGAFGTKNDGVLGAIGTNSGVAGGNIITLTGALAGVTTGTGTTATNPLSSIGGGLNIGLAPRINGQYYLGALANFLQNSGEANVLSTPNLLTLDNEEAKILIGSNVPFLSGSYANATSTSGTVNPFNTVERKDVGLVLKVRPQINENGTVKLAVYQEVSKIDDSTRNDPNGATTSKRSIESNVLVEDGGIIVIGGLLEDDYSQGEDKVPVMGDIPVFGNLFRSENRKRTKTNLMVFLRPIVVRDTHVSDALMLDRYEAIRALQQNTQPEDRVMLRGVSEAPVLPAMRGDAGAPPRMLTSQPQAGAAPTPAPAPAPAAPFDTAPQAPLPPN
ncbi:MAG: type II secretion system secretin GspD [Comamonadaceae bacterium]|nr:type II secretion system secretin GspD [Comamonadaceae bacterium]